MEFILGVFTGAALMMLLGVYLNERDKKQKQIEREKATRDLNSFLGYLRGDPPYPVEIQKVTVTDKTSQPFSFRNLFTPDIDDLKQQLQDAIARDDFEEAARIRDLMNKK